MSKNKVILTGFASLPADTKEVMPEVGIDIPLHQLTGAATEDSSPGFSFPYDVVDNFSVTDIDFLGEVDFETGSSGDAPSAGVERLPRSSDKP